ncbi:hypothetical protein BH11VER1_BH11VER1_08310 [soil metagenome]
MPHWRSKAFYLTRNRSFLIKGSACILGAFMAIAFTANFILNTGATKITGDGRPSTEELSEVSNLLLQTSDLSPEHLLTVLKELAAVIKQVESAQKPSFHDSTLQLGNANLTKLIEQHAVSSEQRELFSNYARCLFSTEQVTDSKARTFLRVQAEVKQPIRYAAEFHADILVLENKPREALPFYLKETAHPDAAHARIMAAKLAIAQKDIPALQQLADDKAFINSCSSSLLLKMARLLDDQLLLVQGLWIMQQDRFSQTTGLVIALFCAFLWQVLLASTAGLRLRQAFSYTPAILAGMLSVWLLHTLQVLLQYDVDSGLDSELSMSHQLFYWVMNVGVPEETVKLCLFLPFLPFLLRQPSGVRAALTAGCVGLGFALNENLQYYQDFNVTVAMSRLLTANIVHISLTGILGYELYLLSRSRFHRAVEFLLTFGAVTLAHGLYDFCNSGSALEGLEIGGIIIVAFTARRYLQCLHNPGSQTSSNQPISRTCIFCFGSSLLVGVLIVVAVLEMQSLEGITLVLKEALGLSLVALIYVREFKEV